MDTIINFLISFHETWSIILKLSIGLLILYLKLSNAILIGFCVTTVLILINFALAKKIGNLFDRIMKFKDSRISLISDILNGIKQVKFLNWEVSFLKKVMAIRKDEFSQLKSTKYLDAFCVFFWASSSIAISAVTFIFYYQEN